MRFLKPLQTSFPRLFLALSCLLVSTLFLAPRAALSASGGGQNASGSGSYGPIVQIISPGYGDVIQGVQPIKIGITPRKYPAQNVELLVDGQAVSGVLAVQTQFKWDTTLFVDGPHTLGVRVTDTQGFIGQIDITVYINNKRNASAGSATAGSATTAPANNSSSGSSALRWLGVEEGQNLSGSTKIALEAGGNFGIKYMFLNLNSAISPDIKPPLASWMTNRAPYEFSVDTTRYKDGLYVLDAYAWDAMENERNAPRLTIGIFNKKPAPDASAPKKDSDQKDTSQKEATQNSSGAQPSVKALAQSTPAPQSAPMLSAPAATLATRNTTSAQPTAPQSEDLASESTFASHKFQQRTTTLSSAQITKPEAAVKSAPVVSEPTSPLLTMPPARVAAAPAAPTAAPGVSLAPQSQQPLAAQSESTQSSVQSSVRLASAPQARSTTPENRPRPSTVPQKVQPVKPALSVAEESSSKDIAPAAQSANVPLNPITSPTAPLLARAETPRPIAQPQVASERSSGSTSVVAHSKASPRSTTAPVESSRSSRATSPRLAALPNFTEPAPRSSKAQLSTIHSAETAPNTRIVFSASNSSLLRIASTHALPTAPRLAFSPSFSKPAEAARTSPKAAIVVAPSPYAPTSHIVQQNESLSAIAARYKMPISAIAAANGLSLNAPISQGTNLLLPQGLLISYKGQAVTSDVAPFLIGSVSVAPFRFLFEKQGGTMKWDAANQRVTARNGDHEISLKIGSKTALVNEQEVLMDMAAFLLSGRTMVPVRFFEKALKAEIEWEPTTGRIYVAMTP